MTLLVALVIGVAAILLAALIGFYRWLTLWQFRREQRRRAEMWRAVNKDK